MTSQQASLWERKCCGRPGGSFSSRDPIAPVTLREPSWFWLSSGFIYAHEHWKIYPGLNTQQNACFVLARCNCSQRLKMGGSIFSEMIFHFDMAYNTQLKRKNISAHKWVLVLWLLGFVAHLMYSPPKSMRLIKLHEDIIGKRRCVTSWWEYLMISWCLVCFWNEEYYNNDPQRFTLKSKIYRQRLAE